MDGSILMDAGVAVTGALLLATVNTEIINILFAPIRAKFKDLDLWWVLYVAIATGFLLTWFAGVNLFENLVSDPIVGRIITGILVGGGSSLLHDMVDKQTTE